ncbi:MAG: outer rane efflux protein [Clostridiales bacterium]|nr:outer rane efflux protein [Clostridiales bacterium]
MKKIISLVMILVLVMATAASGAPEEEDKVMKLDLEKSIRLAMENNLQLQSVLQEIKLREFYKERTDYYNDKFEDAEESLNDARKNLRDVNSAINQIDYALNNDPTLTQEERSQLEQQKAYYEDLKQKLEAGIESGETALDLSLGEASDIAAEKIGLETERILGVDSTTDLNETMARVALEVTETGYEMGKQQVALLVEKNYYDVIKAKNMLKAKKRALERARGQYEIVKAAYEAGMKAKDDMLLAQSQVELMSADFEKAKSELENARVKFKEALNIPFDTKIELQDVEYEDIDSFDLEEGINKGLQNRLEIKKALGQLKVDQLNLELTAKKYTPNTFMYREAKLKADKSQINLEIQRQKVESDIRQSYNTLLATARMREHINNSLKNAQENLEIARYRYNTGFGVPSINLKSIQAEELTGTIMEVLAAQEKLAEIEEKIVEIEAGYNLARAKYLTAIGEYRR